MPGPTWFDDVHAGYSTEPFKLPDQRLVGVLGGHPRRGQGVEPAGIAECVHRNENLLPDVGNLGVDLAPVRLQLLAGRRLESHRGLRRARRPFGCDVRPQHRGTADIAQSLDLCRMTVAFQTPSASKASTLAR